MMREPHTLSGMERIPQNASFTVRYHIHNVPGIDPDACRPLPWSPALPLPRLGETFMFSATEYYVVNHATWKYDLTPEGLDLIYELQLEPDDEEDEDVIIRVV